MGKARVSDALQACERLVHAVIGKSADGIVIVDGHGRIVFVNPVAECLLDSPSADAVKDHIASSSVRCETTELRVVQPGGEETTVEMQVTEAEWEGEDARLCILRDITGRRAYEEKLLESERAMATLMGNLPGMAYRCRNDTDWTMEFVSEGSIALTGYPPDALIQNREIAYGDLIHESDTRMVWDEVQAGVENRTPFRIVYRIATASGEEKWVWEQGCGVFSKQGELVAIEGFITDISEHKRAEERVEALNRALAAHAENLQAANRELEAFSYSVSHDLRNPLSVVTGYVQIVREDCENRLNRCCREYLREAHQAALRMNNLIETLLGFARVSHVELRRETVDLSAMAGEIAEALKKSDQERHVEFRIRDGITANGDRSLLRVAIENLLGNAWKYTGMREDGLIEFGVAEEAGERSFFVRDNGSGFDMAHAEKLFIPFQRLPGAEAFKGHGIGLPMVDRIVRRHGGRVRAEGSPGKGATFYFTLPDAA